jgi:enterobactin synthetase component D
VLTADEVEAVFRSLLPPEARVVATLVADAPQDWSLPVELAKARVTRQREFIAGRWCAVRALAHLGVMEPVGRRADRAPVWPIGVTGSISHTRELAAAAVARVSGLGVDFEPLLSPDALADLRASAISDEEWQLLGRDAALATALFSAKETIFKSEHPRTGVWLEFTDARLTSVSPEALTLALPSSVVSVRYALAHGHAFTALVAP